VVLSEQRVWDEITIMSILNNCDQVFEGEGRGVDDEKARDRLEVLF